MKHKEKINNPLVSVIIPAHNAAEFLPQAMDSILNQSYTNFELIIVDDGSADNTRDIAFAYAGSDPRIQVISYKHNKGESAAANIGYLSCRGKYIARMDADDVSHRDRLAKQVQFLEKHPDHVVVGTQALIINEHDEVIGHKLFPVTHTSIYQEYGVVHPMLHPSVMFRRSASPWPDKLWANEAEPNDDYYTLFHYLMKGKFANLPEKLVYYRMHSNNKSMQRVKSKFINSLRIRWYAVTHLGYKFSLKSVVMAMLQSLFVLTVPEWMTVGLFFWLRGIKSFDQAFPQLSVISRQLTAFGKGTSQPQFALPTLVTLAVSSLFRR